MNLLTNKNPSGQHYIYIEGQFYVFWIKWTIVINISISFSRLFKILAWLQQNMRQPMLSYVQDYSIVFISKLEHKINSYSSSNQITYSSWWVHFLVNKLKFVLSSKKKNSSLFKNYLINLAFPYIVKSWLSNHINSLCLMHKKCGLRTLLWPRLKHATLRFF